MKDKSKEASKNMSRSANRTIKARLSKKKHKTIGNFTKYAQRMVDDIEVGSQSFPDKSVRTAMRNLLGSIEDNLEAVRDIADATGEDDLVEMIDEAADALAPADPDEEEEIRDNGEEEHGGDVVERVNEEDEEGDEDVDIEEVGIDETAMSNYGY